MQRFPLQEGVACDLTFGTPCAEGFGTLHTKTFKLLGLGFVWLRVQGLGGFGTETLNPKSSLNPKPQALNPKPQALNPLNPKPQALNPNLKP